MEGASSTCSLQEQQRGANSSTGHSAANAQLDTSTNLSYQTIDRYGFVRRGTSGASSTDVRTSDAGADEADDDEGVVDVELMRRREAKWVEMLSKWDDFMMRDYKRVRARCRKGIPTSVRSRAWTNLCGAKFLMAQNPGRFKALCGYTGPNKWVEEIEKDLHRNFPTHEMFGGSFERIGRRELFDVLRAYSLHNTKDGFCQAQAPVAALLLMNMPEEEAFWTLVSICERYIPGYYSPGMKTIQLDADILFGLFKRVSPSAHKHLVKQGVEPLMFMTEWFLCVFSRTLPWPSVLRVWDMFMCEGVKVIFKVGLVLLKYTLTSKVLKQCPSMIETLTVLKDLPAEVMSEEFLVSKILALDIDEPEMKREHKRQLAAQAKSSQHHHQRRRLSKQHAAPAEEVLSTPPPPGRSTTV